MIVLSAWWSHTLSEIDLLLKKNRIALLSWLTLILLLGSFATSIANYTVASNSLRQSIVERELPITSDSLYSEIQHEFWSSWPNGLLHDWALAGEVKDSIKRYLNEVAKQNALTSFFVSEKLLLSEGLFKTVSSTDETDQVFPCSGASYEINIDYDAHSNMRLCLSTIRWWIPKAIF